MTGLGAAETSNKVKQAPPPPSSLAYSTTIPYATPYPPSALEPKAPCFTLLPLPHSQPVVSSLFPLPPSPLPLPSFSPKAKFRFGGT